MGTACKKQYLSLSFTLLSLLFISVASANIGQSLSLDEALEIAVSADPLIKQYQEQSKGLEEQAVFDGELSDPKVRFGLFGIATDTFNRSQEPVTQLQYGITQAFPRGRTLHYKSQKTLSLASKERYKALNRTAKIKEQVRLAYLDYLYDLNALRTIQEYRQWFEQLVEITQSHYASGRRDQQDVIQAQLELARLDDKDRLFQTKRDTSASVLARWITPDNVNKVKAGSLPVIPEPMYAGDLNEINDHPLARVQAQSIDAADNSVSQAKQSYWPGFNISVIYGDRVGRDPARGERADLLTTVLTMDLPIFFWDRQTKQVSSAKHQLMAEKYKHSDLLLDLKRQADMANAEYSNLKERVELYEEQLLPMSVQNVEAAMNAYQSGVSDFTDLLRARITELTVKLDDLKIKTDKAKAQSTLVYLLGETT